MARIADSSATIQRQRKDALRGLSILSNIPTDRAGRAFVSDLSTDLRMQKPVGGLMRLIRAFSSPCDVVLYPFCGSRSVPLAAKLSDRRYIGIELRQHYYEIAEQRLKRM